MTINIPEFCIVAMVGVSSSGKTSFARKHFKKTEVLSSDDFRAFVSDDENDQSVSAAAFELLYSVAEKRLAGRRLTVVDATNLQKASRKTILDLATKYHCFAVAIVLDLEGSEIRQRNDNRPDRQLGEGVLRRQNKELQKTIHQLKKEGFRHVFFLKSASEVGEASIVREKLWTDKNHEKGPFDIIGDVHGCYDELLDLLQNLGYEVDEEALNIAACAVSHPEGRRLVFVGDLCDRGPKTPEVIQLVKNIVNHQKGFCVAGNHDVKLLNFLQGRQVKVNHGLQESIEQIERLSDEERSSLMLFLDSLRSHYVLDEGRLVVAHAGIKEEFQGRSSRAVREFSLYGETTGEIDEFGLPVRGDWARNYRGKGLVVYGHTPVVQAEIYNNTLCIDTGCVFGGRLTAFRYPEQKLESVPARKVYYEPLKPLTAVLPVEKPTELGGIPDLHDFMSDRLRIETQLRGTISIPKSQRPAALEVLSRYSVDPRWLIYLPPTIAPCEVSDKADYLEYPLQAFDYYRKHGLHEVIMQEKHMGSRAIFIVCKEPSVAIKRFRMEEESLGVIYTRTGRSFFNDSTTEQELLKRIGETLDRNSFWSRYETDWVCFDAEIMPWSLKAIDLVKSQYAALACSAQIGIESTRNALVTFWSQDLSMHPEIIQDIEQISHGVVSHELDVMEFKRVYQSYCSASSDISTLQIAPFHLLATEGKVYFDHGHEWHLSELNSWAKLSPNIFKETKSFKVQLDDSISIGSAEVWWREITANDGEGVVIKSLDFCPRGESGQLLVPMMKCRGREYLRIIYGPNYLNEQRLIELKKRSTRLKKRKALDEFSIGIQGLSNFVKRAPFHKVHECVFGILALESERLDPRL